MQPNGSRASAVNENRQTRQLSCWQSSPWCYWAGQSKLAVRLSDPNDPTSMSLVDPSNLAGAFGSGVKLNLASVEATDDPLTNSIEGHLPWLKQNRLPKFDDPIFPPP